MKEDLKRLIKKCDECKLNECINCEISYSDIQTIKHLIKAYKEIKAIEESHRKENGELRERVKELEEWNEYYRKEMLSKEYIKLNYIPKSKIKEKIEELNKLITEAQKELGSASKEYTIYVYQKDILQELLEKRK